MKTLKYFVFLLFLMVITIYSCKKDELSDPLFDVMALEEEYPPIISGNGIYDEDTIATPTILGSIRVIPYTVAVMKQAWNNLNPVNQITTLLPTHLYVKFSPASEGEYKLLANTNEMFYDYPLENELISLGDYYPQNGITFPELWAIVPPDFQSPVAGYTIVSELFIPRYNTYLTQEAFNITGNTYDNEGDTMYIQVGGDIQSLVFQNDPDEGDDGGGGGGPGGGSGGGDPEPNPNFKSFCGCLVFSDNRKPGGCVKVKDVEHSQFEGVRKVKIITKDTWFTEDETWTDDQGCWKINDRYYGDMWMWIKFIGPVGQIRGVKDGLNYVLGWSHPMKDYLGKIRRGPPYNNIEVKYDIWQNRGSQAHMHWAASTINNAIHDFHSYSSSEGINTPPWLDIFALGNRTDGLTLLANYIPGPFIPPGLYGWLLPNFLGGQLPDISIGAEYRNSDRLKELTYHEIAHSSHFTKVGPQFWIELQNEEANGIVFHNNPYHQVGGIVDISEAWAYHVGWYFADLHYPNPFRSVTWPLILERTRNRELGHMPAGVFHDLKDQNSNGSETDTRDLQPLTCCFTVSDQVQDFNCGQMFTLLGANIKSPNNFYQQFKTNFGNNDPVLLQNMDNLFNSY